MNNFNCAYIFLLLPIPFSGGLAGWHSPVNVLLSNPLPEIHLFVLMEFKERGISLRKHRQTGSVEERTSIHVMVKTLVFASGVLREAPVVLVIGLKGTNIVPYIQLVRTTAAQAHLGQTACS